MKLTIKPTDLRIGNLLLQGVAYSISTTNVYCYVPKKGQSIFHKMATGQYYTYDKLTPILLTEDLLLDFGFDKNKLRIGVYDLVVVLPNSAFYNGVGFPCKYIHVSICIF